MSESGDVIPETLEEQQKKEKERQSALKEARILKKTVQEMELRIKTQKQTLEARDQSINKLLDMLKVSFEVRWEEREI